MTKEIWKWNFKNKNREKWFFENILQFMDGWKVIQKKKETTLPFKSTKILSCLAKLNETSLTFPTLPPCDNFFHCYFPIQFSLKQYKTGSHHCVPSFTHRIHSHFLSYAHLSSLSLSLTHMNSLITTVFPPTEKQHTLALAPNIL